MKKLLLNIAILLATTALTARATTAAVISPDYREFLSRHDLVWTSITADPTTVGKHFGRSTGYYAGAIMGNGLLGTNLYKLRDSVYRLNVGRSDVTEARHPYNLANSGRLPIGYFTLATVGHVSDERMRLHIYDAETTGRLTTDRGAIAFKTYVHALKNYIVVETDASGDETGYKWDFVAQKAVSPRSVQRPDDLPRDYLNHEGKANPDAYTFSDGYCKMLIQPLATDSTLARIARYYVVAWREQSDGARRSIIATVAQRASLDDAKSEARNTLSEAFAQDAAQLESQHTGWWHQFYREAAFLSIPDKQIEGFYWMQYYKFASTARPGCPIVDLQGVWPTYDTPWPAIWMNLNIQLTYSWQTKANLRQLEQPLWDAFWNNRDNLTRNVTSIAGQEQWTDSRVMPRSSTYDMLAPLDPRKAATNQYEVGNLTWTMFYYWQQCVAYVDTAQMRDRLFPLLKSAVNIFFHIRRKLPDGTYILPSTASPEYTNKEIGTNSNYDLANLRWGLQTLLSLNRDLRLNDPMQPRWQDFLDHLAPFPYSERTGFKVSDRYEFTDTTHRHYSHLFMIYPYHLLSWDNPSDRKRMELSVSRWHGNQGYSRTGKAAMLASKGDGDGALAQLRVFFKHFVRPNTLYNESGPVIETPLAAVSSIHELYMQDWGDRIRVFWGCPTEWRDASFRNMRAKGAFLVSADRTGGLTDMIKIESEKGGVCRLQTGMPVNRIRVADSDGKRVRYKVVDKTLGTIVFDTSADQIINITRKK